MALGVLGFNPVWSEVDLQGKQFDDTFYLFVLQNEIPYQFATVFHDPDMNTPWTQPIQFLGNGTLPVNIYFKPETSYRLEFRQGNTQQAPLIYLVENYIPGSGGSTPISSVAFASSNEITNPQFALFSLKSPTVISGTNPTPISIAPGWDLLLSGTGTLTINRVALNNSNANPSNAPYALRLTMNGWTPGTVILRQRFLQNGMLWANKIVSSSVTASLVGSPQSITAGFIDSNNSSLGTVLPPTAINEVWNEYTGYAQLTPPTNPNTPPAAYIDYLMILPSNIDIYLTSFQLVVQDLPVQPSFEQDSIQRQIDHTYNTAYPIVPIGTVIDFAGIVVPPHYYLCDGSIKDRVRDYLLFAALSTTETVSLTAGVNTFTVASNPNYKAGMTIEGIGIPASTIIVTVVGNVVTMSNNATVTTPSLVTFLLWGAGNSTTFYVPNLVGLTTAGAYGQLFYASTPGDTPNGVGLVGGEARHQLTIPEMPAHTHVYLTTASGGAGSSANGGATTTGDNTTSTGGNVPHNNIQPTILMLKCIRYQ